MTLFETLQTYLTDCEIRQLSSATLRGYRDVLGRFLSFQANGDLLNQPTACYGNLSPPELSDWHVTVFFQEFDGWRARTGRSPNGRQYRPVGVVTRIDYSRTLRVFFHWLQERGLTDRTIAVPRIREPHHEPPFLPPEIERQILDALKQKWQTSRRIEDHRNYLLTLMLPFTGIRLSELLAIRVMDVTIRGGIGSVLIHGKGRRERIVPLAQGLLRELNFYLLRLREFGYEYLAFSSRLPRRHNRDRPKTQRRLDSNALDHILRRTALMLGIDTTATPVSCHRWRHTWATEALTHGAQLPDVARMLGHSSVETTLIYLHAIQNKQQVVEAGSLSLMHEIQKAR